MKVNRARLLLNRIIDPEPLAIESRTAQFHRLYFSRIDLAAKLSAIGKRRRC